MKEELIICQMTGGCIDDIPSEVKLIPLGAVKSQKGNFQADEESYRMIRKQFEERRLDMVIDYEHQTLKDVQAPASGWIKDISLGKDAIIAKVEWTERAREYLSRKEYRYLSPVILARKSDRKVIGLHSAALTNTPAIDGMFAVVNAVDAADYKGGKDRMELKKLIDLLGLGEESTEADVLAAICGLQEAAAGKGTEEAEIVANSTILSLLGLEAATKTEDVLVAIAALKSGNHMDQELMALKRRMEERDADDAVEAAMKEGKISAAMKGWAKEYALKDPGGFKNYVEKAPAVVPMGRLDTQTDSGRKILEDAAVIACKQMGLTEEDMKKFGGGK